MYLCASVAISGFRAMVCWSLQLCMSCVGVAVWCCIMSMSLRSAKARFCVLAATLSLMMGHVWAGIFLACLHPSVSLALLLCLLACWGTGRRCMSLVPVLNHTACGIYERPRRRRLPRDLRKQCKRAAKEERRRIFHLGSRFLFVLRLGQRCLPWIYGACCLRLACVCGILFYMVLSFSCRLCASA